MLKGEVELIFRDSSTGEITKTHRQKNLITDDALLNFANYINSGNQQLGRYLFIGGAEQSANRDSLFLYDPLSIGIVESGIDSPLWIDNGEPNDPYVQYQNRFLPPTLDRDIYTIGVQYSGSFAGAPDRRRPAEVAAYVALSSSVTQTTTETLDVFYRIIFEVEQNSYGFSREQVIILAQSLVNTSTVGINSNIRDSYPVYNCYFLSGNLHQDIINRLWLTHGNRTRGTNQYSSNPDGLGGDLLTNRDYSAKINRSTLALDQSLGRIIGTLGYNRELGNNTSETLTLFHSPVLKNDDSPVQTIYQHSAAANVPFFNSAQLGTTTATINIDGSSWTNPDYPHFYRVEVESTGNTGTATYRFKKRDTVGFINNTYKDDHVPLPYLNSLNNEDYLGEDLSSTVTSQAFVNNYGPQGIAAGKGEMILFSTDWVALINIMTGERQKWKNNTTPSAAFTNTRQITYHQSTGDIWVADDSGLYRLDSAGSGVDVFNPSVTVDLSGFTGTTCYGITITAGGKVWALFDGGLAESSDSGVSWTTHTTLTVPSFDNIFGIQGDPNHSDDRLAIIYAVDPNAPTLDIDVYWWDRVADATSTNVIDRVWFEQNIYFNPIEPRDLFTLFTCSPSDGVWGTANYGASDDAAIFSYDTSTPLVSMPLQGLNRQRIRGKHYWGTDINGDDALLHFLVSSSNDHRVILFQQDGNFQLSDILEEANQEAGGSERVLLGDIASIPITCWLPGGKFIFRLAGVYYITMFSQYTDQLGGQFQNILWKDYGWDGSSWVRDEPGNKTTHAGPELLLDGLTISFDDSGATTSFDTTDYFTVPVVKGIMADGATRFTHDLYYYFKPAVFDVTDTQTPTLPNAVSKKKIQRSLSWTDTSSLEIEETDAILTSSSTGGARSVEEIDINHDCEIKGFLDNYASSSYSMTFGFSDATKKGTTLDQDDVDYGIRFGTNNRIAIYENGVEAFEYSDGLADPQFDPTWPLLNTSNADDISFKIERVGTTVRYYVREQLIYTSAIPSNTALCVDYAGNRIGAQNLKFETEYTDYFGEFGNLLNSTGLYDNNFHAVVNSETAGFNVQIGGVDVTQIAEYDIDATLNSGEISVFPLNGVYRFSPSDQGTSASVNFTYVRNN
jgi:hypothetical protein